MLAAARLRTGSRGLLAAAAARRTFAMTASRAQESASTATTTATATTTETTPLTPQTTGTPADGVALQQAPNRAGVWTRNQQARDKAMTGPRFEQTDFTKQPQPYSAMELIHKQPVRWTHERIVSCDGGGGPHGHPRIFINTDKPQICACGYCGTPYANEHHRKHLESLPQTSYPLE